MLDRVVGQVDDFPSLQSVGVEVDQATPCFDECWIELDGPFERLRCFNRSIQRAEPYLGTFQQRRRRHGIRVRQLVKQFDGTLVLLRPVRRLGQIDQRSCLSTLPPSPAPRKFFQSFPVFGPKCLAA